MRQPYLCLWGENEEYKKVYNLATLLAHRAEFSVLEYETLNLVQFQR